MRGKVSCEVEEVNTGRLDTKLVDLTRNRRQHEATANEINPKRLTKCDETQLENKARW